MQSSLYVSLSGILATSKRMETVANNVANASTPGFRSEEIKFEEVLAKAGADNVSFSTPGETYISKTPGVMNKTDNPLDFAISGDAFFSVQSPQGVMFTRDGRFQISANGSLETLTGHAVLDGVGSPVMVPADGGAVSVGRDGSISQNNIQVGVIGLFEIPVDAKLTRGANSGVFSDKPGVVIQDFTNNGILQGFSEGSNVNPVLELVKMISTQRTFDSSMAGIRLAEDTEMSAIRSLGPST